VIVTNRLGVIERRGLLHNPSWLWWGLVPVTRQEDPATVQELATSKKQTWPGSGNPVSKFFFFSTLGTYASHSTLLQAVVAFCDAFATSGCQSSSEYPVANSVVLAWRPPCSSEAREVGNHATAALLCQPCPFLALGSLDGSRQDSGQWPQHAMKEEKDRQGVPAAAWSRHWNQLIREIGYLQCEKKIPDQG